MLDLVLRTKVNHPVQIISPVERLRQIQNEFAEAHEVTRTSITFEYLE
jgi:hypothetical protein